MKVFVSEVVQLAADVLPAEHPVVPHVVIEKYSRLQRRFRFRCAGNGVSWLEKDKLAPG